MPMTLTESHTEVDLVTKSEAAAMLRVSVRTVDRYLADGTLTRIRISSRVTRIPRSDVQALATKVAA
jgi:excisionase family DNA binding protein